MDKDVIIALVNRSPELVDKHDREGWLDLFSANAVVEDPVGAGGNRKGKDIRNGRDGLGRFYDIFIAPNKIEFDVHRDIVVGAEMVREVSIHTTMPNGAITVVDCNLIYGIVEERGQPKIDSLRAHWDLRKNALALIRNNGVKGISASASQFGTMIKVQGIKRVIEYLGAMYKGILGKGAKSAVALTAAVNAKNENGFARLFESGATIDFPVGRPPISADGFLRGAGRDIKLDIRGLRSGGWFTSAAFAVCGSQLDKHGVVFFEFSPKSKRIVRVRFFWNS